MNKKDIHSRPRLDDAVDSWERTETYLFRYIDNERSAPIYAPSRRKLYALRERLRLAYTACSEILGEIDDIEVSAPQPQIQAVKSTKTASQEIIERTTTERIIRTSDQSETTIASQSQVDAQMLSPRKAYLQCNKEFIYAIADKQSDLPCINDLTKALRKWFTVRFMKKWTNFKRYTYNPNQIAGFIQQFVARYAYDLSQGNTAEFNKQLNDWIKQMDIDEVITSKSSMPSYIYQFEVNDPNNYSVEMIYVWWAFVNHIQSEMPNLQEHSSDIDTEYIDNIAISIVPDIYESCKPDMISVFIG